jgi:MFS family permease
LVSYWLEYGTHYIGGIRCAPGIPYSGGTSSSPTFNPLRDVGPQGCTGQSDASWRVPFALQIVPALVLGIGMLAFPESPRFLLKVKRDDRALAALSKIRRMHVDTEVLRGEFLAIKAEVLFEERYIEDHYPGKSGISLMVAQYKSLLSTRPAFRRLSIGCCIMYFQQFIGQYFPSSEAEISEAGTNLT